MFRSRKKQQNIGVVHHISGRLTWAHRDSNFTYPWKPLATRFTPCSSRKHMYCRGNQGKTINLHRNETEMARVREQRHRAGESWDGTGFWLVRVQIGTATKFLREYRFPVPIGVAAICGHGKFIVDSRGFGRVRISDTRACHTE